MARPRRAIRTPWQQARAPVLAGGCVLVAIAGVSLARAATPPTVTPVVAPRTPHVDRHGPRPPVETPTPTPAVTLSEIATPTPTASPTPPRRTTARPTPTRTATKTTAVAKSTPKPATTTTAVTGGGSCPTLQGGGGASAKRLHQALCARFPQVRTYYGYRPEAGSYHGTGQAIDAMVGSDFATGQEMAEWARANAAEYGIIEVIWNQKIWTTQRSSEGWRKMADRGSITANHKNHPHLSVR